MIKMLTEYLSQHFLRLNCVDMILYCRYAQLSHGHGSLSHSSLLPSQRVMGP